MRTDPATLANSSSSAEAESGLETHPELIPPQGSLLTVRDLRVQFFQGNRVVRAVDGVSYSIDRGKTLAIIGESGSGKTVSSRAIMGLLPRDALVSGSALFEGIELIGMSEKALRRHRGSDFAMVFQDPARSLNPTMRVGTQLTEAIHEHLPLSRSAVKERAIELLQMVRLPLAPQRFHEYPHQLSGGMRQRVMIAMALACRPKLLIADEATTALDVTTQAQIMELLMELQRDLNMALILISHDMGLAASFTDRVAVMYAGRVVEQAPTQELFADVRMPYTMALLDAIPRMDREPHSDLPVVPGRPPDLTMLPTGCSFSPRCPSVQDDCRVSVPELQEDPPGHWCACLHPLGNPSP